LSELIQNPKQVNAFHDICRNQLYVTGRRGGKTTLLIEKIIKKASLAPNRSDIFYIGPTNQHAMSLAWEPLIDTMIDLNWPFKDRVSKKRIQLPGRRNIYVIGAEKISLVRGHAACLIVADELAYWNIDLGDAMKAIRPALSDFAGDFLAATTPDGKGTQAHELWMKAKDHPDWSRHHWYTRDNPWISLDEIEAAKRDLDERSFKQEYEATWESFGELAYYNFDDEIHVKEQPPIVPGKPMYICLDFNVNPTTLIVRQTETKGHLSYLSYKREYSLHNSSTEQTIEQFCDDFKNYKESVNIFIRGDSTGNNRTSKTGKSDYYYVKAILDKYGYQYSVEVPSINPPIVDRVKYLNGWLKPVQGPHRIEFDPSLKWTIKDLSSQGINGRHPDPKGNLGHKADAVGYDVYYEQRGYASQKTRTLEL